MQCNICNWAVTKVTPPGRAGEYWASYKKQLWYFEWSAQPTKMLFDVRKLEYEFILSEWIHLIWHSHPLRILYIICYHEFHNSVTELGLLAISSLAFSRLKRTGLFLYNSIVFEQTDSCSMWTKIIEFYLKSLMVHHLSLSLNRILFFDCSKTDEIGWFIFVHALRLI